MTLILDIGNADDEPSLSNSPAPIVYYSRGKRGIFREAAMKYAVVLEESEEGFAASVPGLPGCHSQGATEAEALANIADAIREWLDVAQELARSSQAKQVQIEV